MTDASRYALTLSCADQPGIVHAISGALVAAGGNITESQQYGSTTEAAARGESGGRFFMRVEATTSSSFAELKASLSPVAERFDMAWELHRVGAPVRTLILASKDAHCLNELLFQQRSGQLPIEVPAIVSNHADLAEMAAFHGVPFHHLPVTAENKPEAERALIDLVAEHDVELVVLARVHADPLRWAVPGTSWPGDQHSPLVPALFQGCPAVCPSSCARRQVDWRHGALCDRRSGRGTNHRTRSNQG